MLTEVASPVDVLKLDYDAAGQLARQQRIFESVTYSLERRYDAAGRLTGLTYPDADTVGTPSDPIRYDAAGRLQSIPGFVSNFDWDASGRMIFQVNLNGTVTTRTFSPERGHLTRILTTGPGGTLQDLQYTQDETGRITAVSSPFATESWSYGYDDLGRLVQADNVSDPLESQAFAYDAVGNMTYNSRVGNYLYPSPGQPRPHAPTTINGGSMTYDPNGNLLTGRGRTYTWDWENLPTQINTTQFVYGADRSRLKKLDSGNATLYPLGDDYEIVGGVVTKYVNAVGVGVLGKRVGATPYWSHLDHLGSITLTTDGAGLDNLRRSYRPYGDLLAESGSGIDSRGYIDQREDDETLVTYLHARYYDPQTALFVGPDPLAPFLDGVGPAKYAYALGDPVGGADRSGLIRCGRYSPDGKHCELWILDPVYNDPFTGPRPDGGGGGGSGTGGDGCSRGPNRCTEDGPRGPDRGREPDPRTPTPPGPPSPGRPPSTHPGSTCPPGKQCNSNNSEPACANGDANCDGSIDSAEMAAFVDRTVATTTTNPWITHPCSTGVTWNLYVRSFLDGVGIGLSLVGQFPASVVAPHVATRFSRAGLIGNVGNAAARVNSWDSQILPGPPAGTFSQTCN